MYRILLVEDEPPTLDMIKNLINSSNKNIKVTSQAYNGREALEILKYDTTDVIITDLKMPFIDGLELISKVNSLYHQIKCVILSGYSDFEYARSAIKLNVFEYVLKPVKSNTIFNLLDELISELDKSKRLTEYNYIYSIINQERIKEIWQTNLTYSNYHVILTYFGSLSKQFYELISLDKDCLNNTDFDFLKDISKEYSIELLEFQSKYSNGKIIVAADTGNGFHKIKGLCEDIYNKLNKAQVPISMIYSEAFTNINYIPQKINSLHGILHSCMIFGRSKIYNEQSSIKTLTVKTDDGIRILQYKNNFNDIKTGLIDFFDNCNKNEATQVQIEEKLNQIFNNFEKNFNIDITNNIDVNEITSRSGSYQELYENTYSVLKNFYETNQKSKLSNLLAKELVDKIELYLKEHFSENIDYDVFGEMFNYNVTYISNVFKKEKGISPSKYITKVRMEKAKGIIKNDPEILLKSVSEMVGYGDPLYFSRVFKEWTGISPINYAKSLNKHL